MMTTKKCFTCGNEFTKRDFPSRVYKYCSKACSLVFDTISEHVYENGSLTTEYEVYEYVNKDISVRQLKELLLDNPNVIYTMFKMTPWTKSFGESLYCLKNNITSQPVCQHCGIPTNYDSCKTYIQGRYSIFCEEHKLQSAYKAYSDKFQSCKNIERNLTREELKSELESINCRNDKLAQEAIRNGLYKSIFEHTTFFDKVTNRGEIKLTERIQFILKDLTELPLCSVCGLHYVKPYHLKSSYKYMDFCSNKCNQKLYSLRNKSQEEMDEINFKRMNNGYHGVSKISQNLFNELIPYIKDTSDLFFHEHNKEKTIKTTNGTVSVDFLYKNKIIEFNGDNIHYNPLFFRPGDLKTFIRHNKNEEIDGIWIKDYKRTQSLINKGYEVLIIWENDYKKFKKEVINKCLNFLDINTRKV